MSYRTDRARAEGLGSAKDGVKHWWEQRISAVAMMLLMPLFIFPFAYNLGDGYEQVLAAYSHPINAVISIAFIATAFLHLYQGLQVVIEDYVHSKLGQIVWLMLVRLACSALGLIGIFSVAKIAFGG